MKRGRDEDEITQGQEAEGNTFGLHEWKGAAFPLVASVKPTDLYAFMQERCRSKCAYRKGDSVYETEF